MYLGIRVGCTLAVKWLHMTQLIPDFSIHLSGTESKQQVLSRVISPRDQTYLSFNEQMLITPHLDTLLGASLLRLSTDWLSFYLRTVFFSNTYIVLSNPSPTV